MHYPFKLAQVKSYANSAQRLGSPTKSPCTPRVEGADRATTEERLSARL